MAETIGLRAEAGLNLRDRADEILYGWLIGQLRGRGGRSRAAAIMKRYLRGDVDYDERIHCTMLGIRMGLRNSA